MVRSRKPKSNSVLSEARQVLLAHLKPDNRLTVALSGGVESVVLLHALVSLAKEMAFTLSAVHVNHGISGNATQWGQFCRDLCRRYGISIDVADLRLPREKGASLEAVARQERYRIFSLLRADYVVLAQHLDDQAETLLLQLLRGSGIKGLSGMPTVRKQNVRDAPQILRPLLQVSRDQIEAYARQNGLDWIVDESNDSTAFSRNFLRHEIFPLLKKRYPGYLQTFSRASRHLAEAGSLLDELAELDSRHCLVSGRLQIDGLRKLSAARVRNLLRYVLSQQGVMLPNTVKLEEILRQILTARPDRRLYLCFGDTEIRCFQGAVYVQSHQNPIQQSQPCAWNGEAVLALDDLNGALRFEQIRGQGIDLQKMRATRVTVRLRKGGEHFKPYCNRPTRSLKNLLQEAAIPPWQRHRLPLLFCDERLVWVPEIGIDCEFQVKSDALGVVPLWDVKMNKLGTIK